jgi:hypothetical protein
MNIHSLSTRAHDVTNHKNKIVIFTAAKTSHSSKTYFPTKILYVFYILFTRPVCTIHYIFDLIIWTGIRWLTLTVNLPSGVHTIDSHNRPACHISLTMPFCLDFVPACFYFPTAEAAVDDCAPIFYIHACLYLMLSRCSVIVHSILLQLYRPQCLRPW